MHETGGKGGESVEMLSGGRKEEEKEWKGGRISAALGGLSMIHGPPPLVSIKPKA